MEVCPHHGGPRSECGDPDRRWYPQRHVCHADMEQKAAQWLYAHLHEALPFHDGTFRSWAKVRSRSHPYHFADGVRITVATTDLTPDDDFLTAKPVPEREDGDDLGD